MWVKAASLGQLQENPVVLKHSPKQIAIFRVDGQVYAIDNRCPHEGYPLAVGKLSSDCVLTCNWHNWKFRLDTGECLIGGDDVRSYPTKIEEGHAWVDIADPPPEESRRRILDGLHGAFGDRDFGRICRDVARLEYNGLNAIDAVVTALDWTHDRLEFGTTHSIAGTADWLRLAQNYASDFECRLICISEAVDHLSFDSLRQPQYPYADPGAEPFEPETFLAAVEAEDARRVEAMVARALADGRHWADMDEAFTTAALAHYNDFGHSLIYVAKTDELLTRLGSSVERSLLLPLARNLCYTTREDLLPEFSEYPPALAVMPEPASAFDSTQRPAVSFPSSTAQAFAWLRSNLATHNVEQVYDAMLEALALNLLYYDMRYDTAYDGSVTQNISWLDFTHGITFSNAARRLCSRYPHLWKPALAQMACFLGRNHSFLDPSIDRSPWTVDDPHVFFDDVHQRIFDHGHRDPIFSVHLLKTSMAVADELQSASPSCRGALLASLNRFLNSPIKQKHVRRLARQAINLVRRDFAHDQSPIGH